MSWSKEGRLPHACMAESGQAFSRVVGAALRGPSQSPWDLQPVEIPLAVCLGATRAQLGLTLCARSPCRILDQEEGLLGFAFAHDALLILRLADPLEAQVAPAAQNQGAQGCDGDEDDDDRHHPRGGAVVHDGHGERLQRRLGPPGWQLVPRQRKGGGSVPAEAETG